MYYGNATRNDADKSSGEQCLAMSPVPLHLVILPWDTVKSSVSVKATSSVPEQYMGLRWAGASLQLYLDCLDKTVLIHIPPQEGFFCLYE